MADLEKVTTDSDAFEKAVEETVNAADQLDAVDLNKGIRGPKELRDHLLQPPVKYERLGELVKLAKERLGNDGAAGRN